MFLKGTIAHSQGRVTEKDGETNNQRDTDLPLFDSCLQCMQRPRLGQAKTRDQYLHLGLPRRWQGPEHLGHHVLPLRLVSKKLGW